MITADNITDEQICELQRTQSPLTGNCAYLCTIALGRNVDPHVSKHEARARCAEILNARAENPPRCDYREEHDDLADMPVGARCKAFATHRIEWADGRRFSYGCDAHLKIDDAATVKPARIVRIGGAK